MITQWAEPILKYIEFITNFIPQQSTKFEYKQPVWMNPKIISSLKDNIFLIIGYLRFNIFFCKNPTHHNKKMSLNQWHHYADMIIQAKEKHITLLNEKHDEIETKPKSIFDYY